MADPVADFYAREQDMFADLEAAPAPANPAPVADALVDDFGELAVAGGNVVASDSGVDLAAMDFQPAPVVAPIGMPLNGVNGHMSNASSKGPSPVPSMPRIEAENIRRWREEQKVLLEKKDEAEEKKKGDLKAQAKKELDDWYAQREATLKGSREANLKAEADHVAGFAKEQGEGAQWDEIAKLCEAKAQKGGKDVSRLKSLLLHLKEQNSKKQWQLGPVGIVRKPRMTFEALGSGPTTEELLQLLQQQDAMMESVQEEMNLCKSQLALLRDAENSQKTKESETAQLVADAQMKMASALTCVDVLQIANQKLEEELASLRRRTEDDTPLAAVMKLKKTLGEKEFELERERRLSQSIADDLLAQKTQNEQLNGLLASLRTSHAATSAETTSRIETLSRELGELRVRYESQVAELGSTARRATDELTVCKEREQYLEAYNRQLCDEAAVLRGEKAASGSRIASLVEENASLRTKLMRARVLDSQSGLGDGREVEKLLADQSHLIAALREEVALLSDGLENERSSHRSKVKALKREKADLERRLERLLQI